MPDDGDLAHILGVVDHMLEEKLRDRGGEKALFHGDADLARLLDVERQRGDAVASGLDELCTMLMPSPASTMDKSAKSLVVS